MAVTRERFNQGLTYQGFKDSMTQNREPFENNERNAPTEPEDVAAFSRLSKPLDVLVIAGDWCADVIANLPILGRLALESGKLNLRVFDRDTNEDLMSEYLNGGQFRSVPVFAFFDADWRQLGVFTERPKSVTEFRAKKRLEIFTEHPEFGSPNAPVDQLPEETRTKLNQTIRAMRAETAPFANREVIRELRAIVEKVPVG
ncbi:MAG: hypothetical protein HW416_611 [Chloroflexi bacterium]|nr:hypothetical protein [Chloroflexota bacterium]